MTPNADHNELFAEVKALISKPPTTENVARACYIYSTAITMGPGMIDLAELSKDVLKIWQIEKEQLVLPELHKLLTQVPDVYYDFIYGIEHNIENNHKLQLRTIEGLRQHPDATSSDVIIYTSLVNAHPDVTAEETNHFILLYQQSSMEPAIKIDANGQTLLNHGWSVTRFVHKKKGYTIRSSKNVCFLDHRNHCIGEGMIIAHSEDTACIICVSVPKEHLYPESKELLIGYMETMAKQAGFSRVIAFRNGYGFNRALMEGCGFRLVENSAGQPDLTIMEKLI